MSDVMLRQARNITVRDSFVPGGRVEIAWGEGTHRQTILTDSAQFAAAVVTADADMTRSGLEQYLARTLGLGADSAGELVQGLLDYGLYAPERKDLSSGEQNWLDLQWGDALELHLATHDMMWVHDYTGDPKVMTRTFVDRNVMPDTPPPTRRAPVGEPMVLPEPATLDENFADVLRRRRTTRRFGPNPMSLRDVATVLAHTFAPRWPAADPIYYATQTYSRGNPFVGFVVLNGEFDGVRYANARFEYDPVRHALCRLPGEADYDVVSDLLWTQSYADDAPMSLFLAVDWNQYMWKYRSSRAYRWVHFEAGAFTQTALTVATGLGVKTFQTPALDDERIAGALQLEGQDLEVVYFAAFGR